MKLLSLYEQSGVSITRGDAFAQTISERTAPSARNGVTPSARNGTTPRARRGVLALPLNFAAAVDFAALDYADPVMLLASDGVGTKLLLAEEAIARGWGDAATIRQGIGQDLVAMCANDVLCHGGQMHWFLDYYATGRLDPAAAAQVIDGIVQACETCEAALVGGETAEMPGMYAPDHYDLAGFAVGAVDRARMLQPQKYLAVEDRILGFPSAGFHSNGFSLVRHVLKEQADAPEFVQKALAPTRLYWPLLKTYLGSNEASPIKGLAHITGGGLAGNVQRLFPEHLAANLRVTRSSIPEVFTTLQDWGGIPNPDMLQTFNMGIGMVAIVAPDHPLCQHEEAIALGTVIPKPATLSGEAVLAFIDETS